MRKKTNKEVIEKYSEKIDDFSEEAIDMETRQSCTEINISNCDRESRENIQLLKMSFKISKQGLVPFMEWFVTKSID